jgi:hypothetical protein
MGSTGRGEAPYARADKAHDEAQGTVRLADARRDWMNADLVRSTRTIAAAIELLLALGIIVGVIAFACLSTVALIEMDWRSTETFYELIYRVLLVAIGVELTRTLVTHDLAAIMELLAFVVARKMLKPDLTSVDVVLGVGAFVALLAARRLFLSPGAAHSDPSGAPGREAA